MNPECSCLHKLCWSLQPSQLICCPRSAKSLFYFDFFCDLCGYNYFKISRSTLRCFLLLRDSNILTLRSDCCFVFVAESNTKGQQLGLRRRLPCFSFSSSSSPSPCQGPASAELDPFAGICSRPIVMYYISNYRSAGSHFLRFSLIPRHSRMYPRPYT